MSSGLSTLSLATQSAGKALAVEVAFQQGMAGPRGEWAVDRAFQLRQLLLPIVDGTISIDFQEANTYYLLMTENVRRIEYVNVPEEGVSTRIQLYIQQDDVGGRVLFGWPPGTQTTEGLSILLTPRPRALDSVVIDTFDGGLTTQLNLVGQDYRPIAR